MLPELLKLPALGITVYTYGVMLALGCGESLPESVAERLRAHRERGWSVPEETGSSSWN